MFVNFPVCFSEFLNLDKPTLAIMQRISLLCSLLLSFISTEIIGQTWNNDAATIIYNNCSNCHRPGGIGPMSFMSYDEVFPFRNAIKEAIQSRHMPPWPPDPSYTTLTAQRVLTAQQINTLVGWVNNGAPKGAGMETAPPSAPANNLGTTDLELKMPVYTSTATTKDSYMCFVLPTELLTQKVVSAIEVIPGNASIVHHVLVFQDTTKAKRARQLDQNYAGPGYSSFGDAGFSSAILMDAWVPGTVTRRLPSMFGKRIYPGADLVIQVHYPAGSSGQQDSTRLRLYYNSNTQAREVSLQPVLNHSSTLLNGPLQIPANTIRSFDAAFQVPAFANVTVLGVAPHMHLIGESIKVWGNKSGTNDTIRMVDIPHWDFHWQGAYYFQRPLLIPGGTMLRSRAVYNNTLSNRHNPSNPPVSVSLGEGTTDEMMLVYFIYTPYQAGDENILIDSSLTTTPLIGNEFTAEALRVFPNPVSSYLQFFNPLQHEEAMLTVWDMNGRKVMEHHLHHHHYFVQIPAAVLTRGRYNVYLRAGKKIYHAKILSNGL
jgi:hypothetical protein